MKAKLIEIVDETPTVKTLIFEIDQKISYEPGQFIMFVFPQGEKTIRRAYSISSWKKQPTNQVSITLNHVPDGEFSTILFNSKINEEFEINGPHGKFKLNNSDKPAIFIAAGTGITPLMSMIESLEHKEREMTLIYSVKTENDIIFKEKINRLSKNRLRFIPTLTQENIEGWKNGRIDQELISESISHPVEVYICGMPEFVKSVKEHLISFKMDEKDIHTEQW